MHLEELIKEALKEDRAFEDITSLLFLPAERALEAVIVARQAGVLAGLRIARRAFLTIDNNIRVEGKKRDGESFEADETIAHISGNARSILAAERTALNFLGHLSGIATFTSRLVSKIEGTGVILLDTRKTTPLLRALEKEAVRFGGGENHRMSLAEAVILKDNHIRALGGIEETARRIKKLREQNPGLFIEVEVAGLDELRVALGAEPSRIMLDNFSPDDAREAVRLREKLGKEHIPFELSGGINETNIAEYALCGCEYISVGALTHSAPSISFSLEAVV